MRKIALLLLLPLCLAGCAGSAEAAKLRAYFGQVAHYEGALSDMQAELTGVQTLEVDRRPAAYKELALRAVQEKERLAGMSVPPEAVEYHRLLTELFVSFAEFAEQAAASHQVWGERAEAIAAKREQAGKRYQEVLGQLQAEQERLSEQYKLKFE